MAAFPKNLGRSFAGVFSKDNLTPFVLGAAASGVGWRFDHTARTAFEGSADQLGATAATLGIITGRAVVRTNGEPMGRHRAISLAPLTDAQGAGLGVGASLSW